MIAKKDKKYSILDNFLINRGWPVQEIKTIIHTKKSQKIEDYNDELFEYTVKKCNELWFKEEPVFVDLIDKGIY